VPRYRVFSLKTLRREVKESVASQPYLGIGNPLVAGPRGTDHRAWDIKGCPRDQARSSAIAAGSFAAAAPQEMSHYFRGKDANIAAVRRLSPLPETVAELCAVAANLGADENSIMFGAAATEASLKRLSQERELENIRIVHFATHALVAGEISNLVEPSLVLTPPDSDDADGNQANGDDGLLTALEISELKLDADWVILSACNTASGDAQGAEALSGFARAFFYAGARGLLVSHWAVDSTSAVKLTTGVFKHLAGDPTIGRAEALRRAMLDVIDNGDPDEAHPTYWAPFVVVGEGASVR
jgi:CHAT domain-containing protein